MRSVTETGRCWFLGETTPVDELLHLEGARVAGSPPLALPDRLSERQRLETVVCPTCAVAIAELRIRHDAELAEADIRPGGTAGPGRTAGDVSRKAFGK